MKKNKVAYKTKSAINIDGKPTNRLMLVLITPPCAYGKCTMCGFCNNSDENIILEDIKKQYWNGIKGEDFSDIKRIDFPTAGSFYNDKELSPESRTFLFSEVSKLPIYSVMVETRANYVTYEKVANSKEHLRKDQYIELGIGLESANDFVRNRILKKGLSKKKFEKFVDICKETDSRLLAYVLIGSPRLSEREVIKDAVETADFVYKTANARGVKVRIAFKPMFIPEHTELEAMYLNGSYQLPKLWSTIEVIKKTIQLTSYQPNSIFVGMFDENLSKDRFSSNCKKCNNKVVEALKRFNGTQDISELKQLTCDCKSKWKNSIYGKPK
jgi:radical SAM enzyme (TIGR01210 family)